MSAALAPEPVRFSQLAGWFPRQQEACAASDAHQYALYGGCRGPGKSYWLRWQGLRLLLKLAKEGFPKARGALFCESYPILTDRQLGPIAREFPPRLGALRTSQTHGLGFHLRPEYGGGVLALRNLDDPAKYKSSEFAFILVDQLEQSPKETFDVLRGSLRWPGLPRPRFCATANPGGPGHLWVKQLWVDRTFPRELEPLRDEFAFVEAKPEDNPHLSEDYWQMLRTLPEGLRQAWLEGNWSIFEGQFFREWDPHVHVVKPFPIPPEWERFCALDYGYSAPTSVGWYAVNGRRLYRYRELYVTGLGPAALAHTLREMTPREEPILYTAADPSLSKRNEQTGLSNADVMAENGWYVEGADNNRISGWRMLHEYLRVMEEPVGGVLMPYAHLCFFDTCTEAIRTLPALVHDKRNVEDVDTQGDDHVGDECRYAVMSRPPLVLPREPAEPKPEPTTAELRARVIDGFSETIPESDWDEDEEAAHARVRAALRMWRLPGSRG